MTRADHGRAMREPDTGRSSRRFLVFPGTCAVCALAGRSWTVYFETGSWARDHLRCLRCRSIPRERSLATILPRLRPDWRQLTIHESSPGAHGLSRSLARQAKAYSSSQFLEGVDPGQTVDGVRCEDLRRLSFRDDSLDLLITQDVLEHVMDPSKVFAEIRRVLKPDGVHLATFPWNPQLPRTRHRAELDASGALVHLETPEYHGSPVGDGRSLVTVDWGADLHTLVDDAGFDLSVEKLPHDRRRGIDGEYREVFVFTPRET